MAGAAVAALITGITPLFGAVLADAAAFAYLALIALQTGFAFRTHIRAIITMLAAV